MTKLIFLQFRYDLFLSQLVNFVLNGADNEQTIVMTSTFNRTPKRETSGSKFKN
jgi:hypothetical protein